MAASDWGMCKDCQWWQIDPGANIADTTMGVCTEAALQPFRLRVSGTSGCHHYTPGQPTHAAETGRQDVSELASSPFNTAASANARAERSEAFA